MIGVMYKPILFCLLNFEGVSFIAQMPVMSRKQYLNWMNLFLVLSNTLMVVGCMRFYITIGVSGIL